LRIIPFFDFAENMLHYRCSPRVRCRGGGRAGPFFEGLTSNMQILSFEKNTSEQIRSEALKVLEKGGIVAYATESFYALGVPATDEEAVKRLFELKKRPPEKPLPVIIGDVAMLKSIVKDIPRSARGLMEKYWPGPLTIVFHAADNIPALLTGGTGRVAARIPGESTALFLAGELRLPLTATSANPSSQPPAETPGQVMDYFGDKAGLIIDTGRSPGGMPSTIIDVTVTPPRILRAGSVRPDY